MKLTLPDTHSAISYIGALAITAYLFIRPEAHPLDEIAIAYCIVSGGQALGNLSKGGQRWMQGGSTAPDQIIPPTPAPEVKPVPFP